MRFTALYKNINPIRSLSDARPREQGIISGTKAFVKEFLVVSQFEKLAHSPYQRLAMRFTTRAQSGKR
jgi:hypothetical protein